MYYSDKAAGLEPERQKFADERMIENQFWLSVREAILET